MRARGIFKKHGLLAMNAALWGIEIEVAQPSVQAIDGVPIVEISGPLTHHRDWFWDSYDAILDRFKVALTCAEKKCVVLKIDSPGGDVSGCFETADTMRAMAASAGVTLYAHFEGQGTSAAYALACSASHISMSETSITGSVGVISMLMDTVSMDEKMGLSFAVVASGEKKIYSNPHVAISPEAIAEQQAHANTLAESFFARVSTSRGLSTDEIKSWKGGLFVGKNALASKLVDKICTFSELVTMVATGETAPPQRAEQEKPVPYKETVEALKKMAEGEDENEAKKAKAALKAMGEGGEDEEKKKEEKAEDEPPPSSKKPEPKPDAKAKASNGAPKVEDRLSALEMREAQNERKVYVEKYSDRIPPAMKAWALDMSTPQSALESFVKSAPRVNMTAPKAAPATRGEDQNNGVRVSQLDPQAKAELDARMGLSTAKPEKTWVRGARVFPVVTPDQARGGK